MNRREDNDTGRTVCLHTVHNHKYFVVAIFQSHTVNEKITSL